MPVAWTQSQVAAAKRALRESTSVEDAGRALGMSGDNLARRLRTVGLDARALLRPVAKLDVARAQASQRATAAELRDLQRRVLEAEERENFFSRIQAVPAIKVNRSARKSGKQAATPCTTASDWHVGEVVTAEETNGGNTYNLAEARRRAGNFWDNVLWIRRDLQRTITAEDHVLNLNGDLISGSIHQELAETNEVGLVDQVSEAIAMIEPGIRALAPTCRKLVLPCTHGNHGRWTGKSLIKIGWEVSLEAMLYRWLRDRLRDVPNLEWHIPRAESVLIDIMGHRVRFQHGTHIKSQGGIGGILVPLTRWATRKAQAHYYVFGHFHQACAFGGVIVNGSLIGESGYSSESGFTAQAPEQINFVINERRGLRRFDPVSVT